MKTWKLVWSPTGQQIAIVQAKTMKAAKRKAPKPYKRFLGEIYAVAVEGNPSKLISRKLPMSKWKRAKVRRLPGGKFQVKVD